MNEPVSPRSFVLSRLLPDAHEEAAKLLHRSLVDGYEVHLRRGSLRVHDCPPMNS